MTSIPCRHFDGSPFAKNLCESADALVYALGDENALSMESIDAEPAVIEEHLVGKYLIKVPKIKNYSIMSSFLLSNS